jgi:spermidine synthase
MGILLFIKVPEKILLLGAGGGSLIHYLAHYLPESQVTAVEYNAELLEIAQQHLNLPGTSARLNYVIDDAREFIQATTEKYDLVIIDIFEGGQSPLWSLQKPFNQQLQHCLTQQGAVAYNLLINSEPKFSRFYQLIRQLYAQQSLCLETEDYENILVYALNHNTGSLTMEQQMLRCEQLSQRYELPFRQILKAIYTINPLGSGII